MMAILQGQRGIDEVKTSVDAVLDTLQSSLRKLNHQVMLSAVLLRSDH